MANASKSAKGNPAHARMANKHRVEYRTSRYVAQKKRKEQRRKEQAERHAVNVKEEFTAWDTQKVVRHFARLPLQQKWANEHA